MAKSLKEISQNVGKSIENILGSMKPTADDNNVPIYINPNGSQTRLEKCGFEARAELLMMNPWVRNYLEYSKALVDAEYMVQSEFDVGSTKELETEKSKEEERAKKEQEKADKKAQKQKKAEEKAKKAAEKNAKADAKKSK